MASRPRSSTPGPGRGRSGTSGGRSSGGRSGRTPAARSTAGGPVRTNPPARSSRTTRTTSRAAPEVAAQVRSSRAKLTGRAAVLLLVVAVLAVSYASSMRAWLKQRSEINGLTAQIAQQQADVAALRQTKQRLHDPAYIKEQARSRFGWIMPGETGYRVIGADGQVLSDGTSTLSDPETVAPKKDPEWWQTAYGSIVAAGEPPSAETTAKDQQRKPAEKIQPRQGSNGQTGR